MRKLITVAAALLFAVSLQAADLTVDDILAKNAAAKGGMDKIRALQTARFSGKMNMGGMEAPFVMIKKRPESSRVEFTIQGLTGIQAYDGKTGWMVMPFMGKKDAEEMTGEMLTSVKDEADFDGPFIDYAKKGNKVELLGKADVEGSPAYKLKLVTNTGNESTIYIDAETFLELKVEAKRKVQGQEVESETTFGNYKEVDGLIFPYSIESKPKGAPAGQVITVEKVELNPAVEDAIFHMPAKKEAAPEAQKQ